MNRMRALLIVILAAVFMTTSCFFGGGRVLITSEPNIADARVEQIMEALQNEEREELRALFSEQALEDAVDFDENLDYLFGYFEGEVQSWERTSWSSDESIRDGEKSSMLRSWYTVATSNGTYKIFIIDYYEDTINPGNEGLYTLRIVHSDDEHKQTRKSWQDMFIPGIYRLEE